MSNDGVKGEVLNSGLFNPAWYAATYKDVEIIGLSAIEHFLRYGLLMGRNPGPDFDIDFYLAQNRDLGSDKLGALLHFIRHGRSEGRAPKPNLTRSGSDVDGTLAPPPFTAPIRKEWLWRVATDAFTLRGLTPSAAVAVIANVASPADWKVVLDAVSRIVSPDGLDLFVFGDAHQNFAEIPSGVRSITHLGPADEARNATGFSRLAASGAADAYQALLWVSPRDLEEGEDPERVASSLTRLLQDAEWGCVAHSVKPLNAWGGEALAKTMRTVLPRLGLTFPPTAPVVAGGGAVWVRPLLLKAVGAALSPHELTNGVDGQLFPGRHSVLSLLSIMALEGAMSVQELDGEQRPNTIAATGQTRNLKAVAFYLPQFHPIPDNDKWWGKGFTEWTNVVRGKPLFRHHYQPRLPADLGYYDLRLEETLVAQADLAREFGIHGFCFYYYWFNGKKLLNQPIELLARSNRVDTGFCVCWANENWSRNWDGQNRHVLLKQDYSLESNIDLIREMIPMMKDPRWIRHNGRPVMMVYRISIIPNWLETARLWREECRAAGLGEIHLCAVRFGLENLDGPPADHGLDSYVLFPPHETVRVDIRDNMLDLHKDFGGEIFDYSAVVDGDLDRFSKGYEWPVHRGTMLGWDNTARRLTSARVFHGATPFGFRRWITKLLAQEQQFRQDKESLLFINAWNEWAEGTYLEPDQRWGRGNLAAFQSAVRSVEGVQAVTLERGIASAPKTPSLLAGVGSPVDGKGHLSSFPVWHQGARAQVPNLPTVMLCAHVSGHHLFGGERSLLDVLDALAQLPLNVVVTLPSANNNSYIAEISKRSTGCYTFSYPQWTGNRSAYAWLTTTFADIIARHNVDIVHANTIVLLEPSLAAQLMRRTSVIHSRELISLDEPLQDMIGLKTSEIVAQVLRRCDWIIGNSRATCRLFGKGDRTLYVPNALKPSDFDMANRYGETIKFGIVSSNIPKKGIEDFVEVALRAADRVPNARFVVVGPESDRTREWAQEVKEGKRPANLAFLGYRETPRKAMSELNVLLNLSHFAESFGRTVAEAMAAYRPVISYDWGALPELVRHGQNGFLVPYKDVSAVVDAIEAICSDRALVEKMGRAGRTFVEGNFTHDNLLRELTSAYEAILGKKIKPGYPSSRMPEQSSSQTIPKTTIIVPVYNAPDEVRDCIRSLVKHTDLKSNRLVIIDDCSPDTAVQAMLSEFSDISEIAILKNQSNIGYTRTINRGIAEAGNTDVVLLNSDTIVTPRWLEGLRAVAYRYDRVGTVTAMSDNAGAFSFPHFNEFCPKPGHLSHDEYALLMTQATFQCEPPEVATGSGFCMFIRRELLKQCGDFDYKGFPRGYGEENDFCMRSGKEGWKHLVSPQSFVFHVRTASFKGEKDALVQAGVNEVIRRYPHYAQAVKASFASSEMLALRWAASQAYDALFPKQ